jgi:hypothetical protein
MQDLGIKVVHQGRDNVGGVVIGDAPVALTGDLINSARDLSEAFAALAGLYFNDTDPVLDEAGLIDMLQGWQAKDEHHNKDAVYKKNFTKSAANAKISARNGRFQCRHQLSLANASNHSRKSRGSGRVAETVHIEIGCCSGFQVIYAQ